MKKMIIALTAFATLLAGCKEKEELTETTETNFHKGRVNTSVCCYCELPAHDAMVKTGNIQNYHVTIKLPNRKHKDEYIVCADCWRNRFATDEISDSYSTSEMEIEFWQQAD